MNAIRFKIVNKILVFGRFCPRTATLHFWRWFCSFQVELARPNDINGNIETFNVFSDAKTLVQFEHRKMCL